MNNSSRLLVLICCYIVLLICSCDTPKKTTTTPPTPPTPNPLPTQTLGAADFKYWIHSPLHPNNNQAVNFKLKVKDTEPIIRIELHVYEYELYKNELNIPSKRRRVSGQWGLLRTWTFANPKTEEILNHKYTKGFPANSNVEYIFKVFNTNNEVTEKLALFDAGNSPWEQDKILLYATTRDPLKETINLCFLPDKDYQQNWNQFLTDTEKLIFQGFHANNIVMESQEKWNFFYTKQEADGRAIRNLDLDAFPAFVKDSLISGVDAFGLLHLEDYGDGAFLNTNFHFLAQNLFTSESYNWGTAIHEAAHALFNLSDEYNGCYCFTSQGGTNIFETEAACESFNRQNGFTPNSCTVLDGRIDNQKWYMSEQNVMFETKAECEAFNIANGYPKDSCIVFIDLDNRLYHRAEGGVCIMQDDGDAVVRSFQRTCAAVIRRYINQLDQSSELLVYGADQDNIYGYEPVILLEMDLVQQEMEVEVMKVGYGIPTKNLVQTSELNVEIMTSNGNNCYNIGMNRPDRMHVHAGKGNDTAEAINLGRVFMAVPYRADVSEVVCKMPKENKLTPRGVDTTPMTVKKFNVKQKIKQAMTKASYMRK